MELRDTARLPVEGAASPGALAVPGPAASAKTPSDSSTSCKTQTQDGLNPHLLKMTIIVRANNSNIGDDSDR